MHPFRLCLYASLYASMFFGLAAAAAAKDLPDPATIPQIRDAIERAASDLEAKPYDHAIQDLDHVLSLYGLGLERGTKLNQDERQDVPTINLENRVRKIRHDYLVCPLALHKELKDIALYMDGIMNNEAQFSRFYQSLANHANKAAPEERAKAFTDALAEALQTIEGDAAEATRKDFRTRALEAFALEERERTLTDRQKRECVAIVVEHNTFRAFALEKEKLNMVRNIVFKLHFESGLNAKGLSSLIVNKLASQGWYLEDCLGFVNQNFTGETRDRYKFLAEKAAEAPEACKIALGLRLPPVGKANPVIDRADLETVATRPAP